MKESELAIIATDRTTLQQYLDTYRRSEFLLPEKALLMAILQDAIDCYRKHIGARAGGKRMLDEAERWIMNDEDDWIFSFSSVCDLLDLDPRFIRRRLLNEKGHLGAELRQHKHRRHAA